MGNASREPSDGFHLLGLAELLFEPVALAPQTGGTKFAFNGRIEAHQIAAGQVVSRTVFQYGEDIRVADLTSNDYQRQVHSLLLNDVQRLNGAKVADRKLRNGDVPIGLKSLQQFLRLGKLMENRFVTAALQLGRDRVCAAIADKDDPERNRH